MFEGVDTVVLQNELAFEDELPFAWHPEPLPLAASSQSRNAESNARLLQVCLTLDDASPVDKTEDTQQGVELARLDMKMNLLLDLMGRILMQNHPRPDFAPIRFNARGAIWREERSSIRTSTGETGVLEIYLHTCLVDPLRLAGRVHRIEAGHVELRFERSSETIANLIDKLTFRRHRRRVADARKR